MRYKFLTGFLFLATSAFAASPAACFAVTSGNWNTPSIWASSAGGAGGTCVATGGAGVSVNGSAATLSAAVPGAAGSADVVVINTGITVHVTAGLGIELGCSTYPCLADSLIINATNATTFGALVHDSKSLMVIHGTSTPSNNYAVINQYAVEQYMPGSYLTFGASANGPRYSILGREYIGCLDQTTYPTPFCSGNGGGWATASVGATLNITFATALPTTLAVGNLIEINLPQTAISGCSYPYTTCSATTAPPAPPIAPRSTDAGTGKICGTVSVCVVPESTPLCVVAISGLAISVGWPQGGNSDTPYCTGTETAAAFSVAGSGNLWVNKPVFVRGSNVPTWNNAVSFAPSSLTEHFDATRSTLPIANNNNPVVVSNAAGTGPGRLGDNSLAVTSNNWGAANTGTPCAFLSIADVVSAGCYTDYDRGLMVSYGFGTSYTGAMTATTVSDATFTVGSIDIPSGVRSYNSLVIGNTDFKYIYRDYFSSFIRLKVLDNSTNRKVAFLFNSIRQCEGLVGFGDEYDTTAGLVASSANPVQINYNSFFSSGARTATLGGSAGAGNINFLSNSNYIDISNNYAKDVRVLISTKVVTFATFSNVTVTNNNFIDDNVFGGLNAGFPNILWQDNRHTGTGTIDGPYAAYMFALVNMASDTTPGLVNRNIFYSFFRSIFAKSGIRYSNNAFLYNWHHVVVMQGRNGYYGGIAANTIFDHNIFASSHQSQAIDGFDSGFAGTVLVDNLSLINNTWMGFDTCIRIGDTDAAIVMLINTKIYNNICATGASSKGIGIGDTGSGQSAQQDQQTLTAFNSFQGNINPYIGNTAASNNTIYQYNRNVYVTNSTGNYNSDNTRNVIGVAIQNPSYTNGVKGALKLVVTSPSSMTLAWSATGAAPYGTPVQLNWTTAGTTYALSSAATQTNVYDEYFTLTASGTPWTRYYPAGGDLPPRPLGCPVSYWALFTAGTNANSAYMVNQCATTSQLHLTPNFTTAPASADTFAIIAANVKVFDAGGTNYVVAGIDARLIPKTAGTYTDTGITVNISDYCASLCGNYSDLGGLPITYTTGVSGAPLITEAIPMYGGSAQHVFANTAYIPSGTGWMRDGLGGGYIGAVPPPAQPTPTGIIP